MKVKQNKTPKHRRNSPTQWHKSVIPAFGRQRQEDHFKFKASLGLNLRPCLKKRQGRKKRKGRDRLTDG